MAALQADLQQVGAEIGQAAAFVISAALQPLKQGLADRDIDTPRASYRKAFGHDSTGDGATNGLILMGVSLTLDALTQLPSLQTQSPARRYWLQWLSPCRLRQICGPENN